MPLRLSLVLFIFFAFAANAQQAEPGEAGWREIRSVIEKQLDAFQRDDAETAFSFASPKTFSDAGKFHRDGESGLPGGIPAAVGEFS
jgi:hypothetical protein